MSDNAMIMSGTPDNHGLELEPIADGLYGLIYTGFWGCKSWCYVAVGADAAIFCQPLEPENGAVGTSITNIWDLKFVLAVAALDPIGQRALYEYYFDQEEHDVSRVTYHRTKGDCIKWEFTDASFAQITGYPEPAFRDLEWGRAAQRRCAAHNQTLDWDGRGS